MRIFTVIIPDLMTEEHGLKGTIEEERDRDLPRTISRERLLPRRPRDREEHFTPVKPRERACEVEAFPLSLSPSSSCRSVSLFLSFFLIYLSISLFLSRFSTPFDLHTVSLSDLIARARLFPSVHECALLCNEEKTHGDFDRIFRHTKRQ